MSRAPASVFNGKSLAGFAFVARESCHAHPNQAGIQLA
jgi:hypothetical protein